MKNLILVFSLFLLLGSCKDQEKKNEIEDIRLTEQENDSYENREENAEDSRSETSADREGSRINKMENPDSETTNAGTKTSGNISNGKYVKIDENDPDCVCYCLEIITSGQSELCLKENEIYINVRFSKNGNTIQVYFTEPSSKNTNDDLPWKDFDTNTPIALITPTTEGIDLDWIGFSINGKLAIDYAIYGKKTLEGSYKKQ